VLRRFLQYLVFARRSAVLLADEKGLFALFVALSVVAALTEAITVMLLVPILETQGQGSLAGVFIIGDVSRFFADYSPSGRIEAVAAAMAVVIIVRGAVQYAVATLSAVIPIRLERKLNLRSYSALMAVEIDYIHNKDYGFLLSSSGGYTQGVSSMLTCVADLIWNGLIFIIYVAIMLAISWRFTLAAVLFLMVVSLIVRGLSSGPIRRAGERWTVALNRVNQVMVETITGMKMVRLAAAEADMTRSYSDALQEATASRCRSVVLYALTGPLLVTAGGVFVCLLLFGSAVLHEGEPATWMSSILLFLFLLFRLMTPVATINTARARIVGLIPLFDQLNRFYDEVEHRQQPSGSRLPPPLRQGIAFEDVGFSYPANGAEVIRRFAANLECGKMTAIVGPSGAGKTTLIALLTRLYDPGNGRILADGTDIREFDVRAWRRRLAVVSQDTFIFNDTVANNIAFGHSRLSLERIRAAARFAAADEFIEQLPQGYDTILGDRGVRLSGGQQQRISIARAIIADPDVLILDEATSNLDTFTERAIQAAIERASKERTVLVVAHRLSTIRRADKVIVMDSGRLLEEGRHDELMARRGFYREMVENQRLDLVRDDHPVAAVPIAG